MRIELIEQKRGDTDFICDRGYGIHHLEVLVDDMDETIKLTEQSGFRVTMLELIRRPKVGGFLNVSIPRKSSDGYDNQVVSLTPPLNVFPSSGSSPEQVAFSLSSISSNVMVMERPVPLTSSPPTVELWP